MRHAIGKDARVGGTYQLQHRLKGHGTALVKSATILFLHQRQQQRQSERHPRALGVVIPILAAKRFSQPLRSDAGMALHNLCSLRRHRIKDRPKACCTARTIARLSHVTLTCTAILRPGWIGIGPLAVSNELNTRLRGWNAHKGTGRPYRIVRRDAQLSVLHDPWIKPATSRCAQIALVRQNGTQQIPKDHRLRIVHAVWRNRSNRRRFSVSPRCANT